MVGSGHVNKGAIYSIAGDSKWAGSTGFEVRLTRTYFLYIPGLEAIVEKVWNWIQEGRHG
jgi:hypothetical protein